jgi:hypothetical protein
MYIALGVDYTYSKNVYMMHGYSHCNTDELQHFKVPVFREKYYLQVNKI